MSESAHLTGAYAVNALPEPEREQFERHLRTCPDCTREVEELRAVTARLAEVVAQPPPVGLKARVLAAVRQVRQSPPEAPAPVVLRPGRGRPLRARPALLVAAATLAVAALGLGALAAAQQQRIEEMDEHSARLERIVADPSRQTRSAPARDGGSATAVVGGGSALVLAEGLPPLPPDRTYQLWVISPQGARSAGLLQVREGRGTVYVSDVTGGERLGMTVEPAGGSVQPTSAPLWAVAA